VSALADRPDGEAEAHHPRRYGHHSWSDSITYPRTKGQRSSVIEDLHLLPVDDVALPGIIGVQIHDRLALAAHGAIHMDIPGVEEVVGALGREQHQR